MGCFPCMCICVFVYVHVYLPCLVLSCLFEELELGSSDDLQGGRE